jgi:hypothetical protein
MKPEMETKITWITEKMALVEATPDLLGWGNATATEPAFFISLEVAADEVQFHLSHLSYWYGEQTKVMQSHKDNGKVELSIYGMQRYPSRDNPFLGLEHFIEQEEDKAANTTYDEYIAFTSAPGVIALL